MIFDSISRKTPEGAVGVNFLHSKNMQAYLARYRAKHVDKDGKPQPLSQGDFFLKAGLELVERETGEKYDPSVDYLKRVEATNG